MADEVNLGRLVSEIALDNQSLQCELVQSRNNYNT